MPPKPAKRSRPLRPATTPFSDHVYREVSGVQVPLRIWPSTSGGKRPWVLWIHGGGLMLGDHRLPNAWVLPALLPTYHVVSVAYRLTPHASFADIVSDVLAAFAWLRLHLPSSLRSLRSLSPSSTVNLDAYAVAGESAGGILSLLLGHLLTPSPRAVFAAYAISDLWAYHPPQPGYYPFSGHFSDAQLLAGLQERDPSKARTSTLFLTQLPPPLGRTPPPSLASALGSTSPLTPAEVEDAAMRNDMSNFALREKLTLPTLFRAESLSPSEYRARVEELSPLSLLRKSRTYPPTVIWHGTQDRGVPHYTHAVPFLERLEEMGVDRLGVFAEGGTHVFDAYIQEPSDQAWEDYVTPTLAFLHRHVRGGREEAKL